MLPTPRELQRLAAETGFRAPSLEKVFRLVELLQEIQRHSGLTEKLVLKGGTALNLLRDVPRRLSVDLDFNYIGVIDREAMLVERPLVEEAIEAIGLSLGYSIQRSRDGHAGRKFYLGYRSQFGTPDRVEVDINFLHRVCLLPVETGRIWPTASLPDSSVRVLSAAELAAGKLCALLGRTAVRDLWDVAHLPELIQPWPPSELRSVFVALASALPHRLDSYDLERSLRVREGEAQRLLQPMLGGAEIADPADLRTRAREILEPLLTLTDAEREFCRRLSEGVIAAELLFPGRNELTERATRHPVLRWKAENVAQFQARRAAGE